MEIKQIIKNISLLTLPWGVVSHDIVVEIPEDVCRGLGCVRDDTGQVDGGASVDVEVGVALYPHMGHCNGGQLRLDRGYRGCQYL